MHFRLNCVYEWFEILHFKQWENLRINDGWNYTKIAFRPIDCVNSLRRISSKEHYKNISYKNLPWCWITFKNFNSNVESETW